METMTCPARAQFVAPAIRNKGIAAQIDMTLACGQIWKHHDGKAYDAASAIEYRGMHISVKAYHFTLMSGTMCKGKTTLSDIWEVYKATTHSNRFAYVVKETAYIMTLDEFREFVFKFCEVEPESPHSDRKTTGSVKVRAKRCENNMIQWFKTKLAA